MSPNEKRNGTSLKTFIVSCLIVVVIWVAYPLFLPIFAPEFKDRGIAGDLFGGFTALFSALAFAGLIFTLIIQKEELSLQREELKRLADEQSNSSESLKKQLIELARTRNQETFFQLLDELRATRAEILHDNLGTKVTGSAAVGMLIHSRLGNIYRSQSGQEIKGAYEKFYRSVDHKLGPYLRTFENILMFIENSDQNLQRFFNPLFQAQLTHDELVLIMMHFASKTETDRVELIKKHSVLRNLEFEPGNINDPKLNLNFVRNYYSNIYEFGDSRVVKPKAG